MPLISEVIDFLSLAVEISNGGQSKLEETNSKIVEIL